MPWLTDDAAGGRGGGALGERQHVRSCRSGVILTGGIDLSVGVCIEGPARLAELPIRAADLVVAPLGVARRTGAPGRRFASVST